jgi:hypothetical protein
MEISALCGAVAGLLGLFPAAFLLALFWKFPIPLCGMARGFEQALGTPIAVVFYGLLGGFVVVPGLGALSGLVAFLVGRKDPSIFVPLSIVFGLFWAAAGCVFLTILDKIIGPW